MHTYFLHLHHISRYGLVLTVGSIILVISLFIYRFFVVNLTKDYEQGLRRSNALKWPIRILWVMLTTGAGLMYYGSTLPIGYLYFGRQVGERNWSGEWAVKPELESFFNCEKTFPAKDYKFKTLYVEAYSSKEVGVWISRIFFLDEAKIPRAVIDIFTDVDRTPFLDQQEGKLVMLDSGDTCHAKISLSCGDNSCLVISVGCDCASLRYTGCRPDSLSERRRKYGL